MKKINLNLFKVIFAIFVLPEFSIASIISLSLINSLPIVKIAMQFNCYRKICRNTTRNSATISTETILKQIIIALIANLFFGCAFGLFLWQHSNHSNSSLVMITIYVLLSQGIFLPDIVPKDRSVFGQHNLWCIRHAFKSQKCVKVKNIYNHSKCPLIHDDRDHIFVTTFVATLIRCFIFCIVLILLVSTDFLPQDWILNRLMTSHIVLRHLREPH